jgi:hypothetical protein
MLVKIQEICLNHFPASEDVGKLEWLLGVHICFSLLWRTKTRAFHVEGDSIQC